MVGVGTSMSVAGGYVFGYFGWLIVSIPFENGRNLPFGIVVSLICLSRICSLQFMIFEFWVGWLADARPTVSLLVALMACGFQDLSSIPFVGAEWWLAPEKWGDLCRGNVRNPRKKQAVKHLPTPLMLGSFRSARCLRCHQVSCRKMTAWNAESKRQTPTQRRPGSDGSDPWGEIWEWALSILVWIYSGL